MKKLATLTVILFFFTFNLSAQKQKVIFDCDLGGDIDDAFAMALLLTNQDKFEILGLCMDHGNTPGRGQIAAKMLYETGFGNIPVFIGRHTPTVVGEQTELEGKSSQMIWSEDFTALQPKKKPAADFILETLNKYPGEVLLFTVGPVDNIADVIDKDPTALTKAKRVVSMFGSIEIGYGGGKPSAEWNVRGSIAAAKKFMSSGANITLAPLDITDHVIYPNNYLLALNMRHTSLTDALSSLYALWFRHADWATQPRMFDGVAVGMALWPELFETKKAFVFVDDEGFTKVDQSKQPNCTIGIKIDDKEFLKRLHNKLITQNFKRK
ncbi:MAG: nucleoside hydrolase [Prolixibacteraceae bacterium]|nr:nucleoside hydrolase [Prolixibacteraceae bacterium]